MIVDCHTQTWDATARLGETHSACPCEGVHADMASHLSAVDAVDRAIVLGFKSNYLGAEIPNRYVSEYVRRYSNKLIGFAGIDPTDPQWRSDLATAQEDLGLKGVAISPSMQDFHPSDTRAMELYEECLQRNIPIVFERSLRGSAAKMEYARPLLLDEVAREFPELRIVLSHMGYPWVHETIVLLAKHRHVYADIAGISRHPWLSYNALMPSYEYGVIDKLLFGSDFPYRSPAECIEALYSLNQISAGAALAVIPRQKLRGIVERDALTLLGIEQSAPSPNKSKTTALMHDE